MRRFVLDASTVLTWCFPDEHSDEAQAALDLLQNGSDAVATAFWPAEVLNALLAGERRRRITQALAGTFLRDLVKLPVTLDTVSSSTVFSQVESLARRHGLTAYDACYLELAVRLALPLATQDKALRDAAGAAGITLVGTR